MDEATKQRLKALMSCPIGQLNLGDAIFVALQLDKATDAEWDEICGTHPTD